MRQRPSRVFVVSVVSVSIDCPLVLDPLRRLYSPIAFVVTSAIATRRR